VQKSRVRPEVCFETHFELFSRRGALERTAKEILGGKLAGKKSRKNGDKTDYQIKGKPGIWGGTGSFPRVQPERLNKNGGKAEPEFWFRKILGQSEKSTANWGETNEPQSKIWVRGREKTLRPQSVCHKKFPGSRARRKGIRRGGQTINIMAEERLDEKPSERLYRRPSKEHGGKLPIQNRGRNR